MCLPKLWAAAPYCGADFQSAVSQNFQLASATEQQPCLAETIQFNHQWTRMNTNEDGVGAGHGLHRRDGTVAEISWPHISVSVPPLRCNQAVRFGCDCAALSSFVVPHFMATV